MKWFFWNRDRPPTLREYPGVIFRVMLFGLITGPIWNAVFNVIFARPLETAFLPFGKFIVGSSLAGAAFATSFYCACRLPWFYLAPLIRSYPATTRGVIVAGLGALSGMVGITLSFGLVSLLPGVNILWGDHFGSILAGEAVMGAVLALVIGTIRSLTIQVRVAEAKIHERELKESALAEAAAKAQATALQAQINPHFFLIR